MLRTKRKTVTSRPACEKKRLRRRKSKRLQEQTQTLCYSSSGLLVDILEHNGFSVVKLECDTPGRGDISLVVNILATETVIRERLGEILAALNFKP